MACLSVVVKLMAKVDELKEPSLCNHVRHVACDIHSSALLACWDIAGRFGEENLQLIKCVAISLDCITDLNAVDTLG